MQQRFEPLDLGEGGFLSLALGLLRLQGGFLGLALGLARLQGILLRLQGGFFCLPLGRACCRAKGELKGSEPFNSMIK